MSRPINIKFDNNLPDIEVMRPMYPTSEDTGGAGMDNSEVMINGVIAPVVKFNNRTLNWKSIISMKISSSGPLPTLDLVFYDDDNTSTLLDTPGPDNTVVVVITPPFDGIYKKIKLRFYIKDIRTDVFARKISCEGEYCVDGLNDCTLEAFGQMTTPEFFEEVSKRLKLGYCTNVDGVDDSRFIYINNQSYLDSLKRICREGGKQDCVLDWWVDMWNNVNLVDVYDKFLGQSDDELTVFGVKNYNMVDSSDPVHPIEIPATITNNLKMKALPLYTDKFDLINSNAKNKRGGTDRVVTTYDIERDLSRDLLVQDGSGVKESVFKKYRYDGEYYGEAGSWLEAPEYASMLQQKISNFLIRVELPMPCFGLMRGGRVNVEWYDESNVSELVYKQNVGMESNIPLPEDDETQDMTDPGTQRLNRKISGQYYIVSSDITYRNKGNQVALNQSLVLSRPVQTYNYSDNAL